MLANPICPSAIEASVLSRYYRRLRFFRSRFRYFLGEGSVDPYRQTLFGFLGWETHVSYEKFILLRNPDIKLAVEFAVASRVARGNSTCSQEAFSTGRVATTALNKVKAQDASALTCSDDYEGKLSI